MQTASEKSDPRPKRSAEESAIHRAVAALSKLNPDSLETFAKRLYEKKQWTARCLRDSLVQVITPPASAPRD